MVILIIMWIDGRVDERDVIFWDGDLEGALTIVRAWNSVESTIHLEVVCNGKIVRD